MEFSDENIRLVDFIGHDDKLLLGGKLDHGSYILFWQTCTCRISWVYYDDCSYVSAFICGSFIGFFNSLQVCTPILSFVEIVGNTSSNQDGERCGIERVLRNRTPD